MNRWLVILLALAACSPQSERERQFYRDREAERNQREALQATIEDTSKDTDFIQLVKQTPSKDERADTESWVDQQTAAMPGQVIFPRWDFTRASRDRCEVRYTFTFLDASNQMSRRGWAWNVDVVANIVGEARELEPEETAPPKRRTETQRLQRRVEEEERSIE